MAGSDKDYQRRRREEEMSDHGGDDDRYGRDEAAMSGPGPLRTLTSSSVWPFNKLGGMMDASLKPLKKLTHQLVDSIPLVGPLIGFAFDIASWVAEAGIGLALKGIGGIVGGIVDRITGRNKKKNNEPGSEQGGPEDEKEKANEKNNEKTKDLTNQAQKQQEGAAKQNQETKEQRDFLNNNGPGNNKSFEEYINQNPEAKAQFDKWKNEHPEINANEANQANNANPVNDVNQANPLSQDKPTYEQLQKENQRLQEENQRLHEGIKSNSDILETHSQLNSTKVEEYKAPFMNNEQAKQNLEEAVEQYGENRKKVDPASPLDKNYMKMDPEKAYGYSKDMAPGTSKIKAESQNADEVLKGLKNTQYEKADPATQKKYAEAAGKKFIDSMNRVQRNLNEKKKGANKSESIEGTLNASHDPNKTYKEILSGVMPKIKASLEFSDNPDDLLRNPDKMFKDVRDRDRSRHNSVHQSGKNIGLQNESERKNSKAGPSNNSKVSSGLNRKMSFSKVSGPKIEVPSLVK